MDDQRDYAEERDVLANDAAERDAESRWVAMSRADLESIGGDAYLALSGDLDPEKALRSILDVCADYR